MPKVNKSHLLLALIFVLGIMLRAYKALDNFPFSAELGDNLIDIKNAIEGGYIPLVGPPTSHPWLSFGPLYYWIMMPVMAIFNYDPMASILIGITAGSIIILLNYIVVKDVFKEKVALLSSFLIAISPLFIQFSRSSRFFFLTVLLFYPFVWLLYKLWNGEKKCVFWLGLTFALFFNFHFSPIILLIPVIILFYIKKDKYVSRDYFKFILGSLLGLLPLLIFDAKNAFDMLGNLLMWFPYRVFGFIGLVPKNTFNTEGVGVYMGSLIDFLGRSFILDFNYKVFFAFFFLIILTVYTITNIKRYKSDFVTYFFLTFFWVVILANFIHLDIPVHYFLPIFPLPIIFISYLVVKHWKDKYLSSVVVGTILLILVINTVESFLTYQYYGQPEMSLHPHFVPYSSLVEVSERIVDDADGNTFSLKRVGPYDDFEENYSQNYKYLMWLGGNEPVSTGVYEYTIFEDAEMAVYSFDSFVVGDIIVVRRDIK